MAVSATNPEQPVDLAHWWQAFDDPTLVRLVEQALMANTDIEAARARVRQARASLRITSGAWSANARFRRVGFTRLGDTAETANAPARTWS